MCAKADTVGFSLSRQERLRSKKLIDNLFKNGESFFVYPFKVIYLVDAQKHKDTADVSLFISVSKKNIKRAVDRNRVRRLVREAWRTQKQPLTAYYSGQNKQIQIALVYTAKQLTESAVVHHKINTIILRLLNQHEVHS